MLPMKLLWAVHMQEWLKYDTWVHMPQDLPTALSTGSLLARSLDVGHWNEL